MLSSLKYEHVVDPQQLSARDRIPLQDETASHVLQCAVYINIQSSLNCGLHDSPHLHTTNPQVTNAQRRNETQCGGGWLVWCCAHCACVPCASCRAVRLLSAWCGEANHDQLGSPAHKEPRTRRLVPVCICRFLTSHLTALTHQLLLLRAGVIYLYTDFPQDEGRTNLSRCVCSCWMSWGKLDNTVVHGGISQSMVLILG